VLDRGLRDWRRRRRRTALAAVGQAAVRRCTELGRPEGGLSLRHRRSAEAVGEPPDPIDPARILGLADRAEEAHMATPNVMKIEFDNARARGYRKRVEVLAFQCKDPMLFMKSWGKQTLRDGSWVIVPVGEDGAATDDVYGCDPEVFTATYEPSPSLRPNRYRKKETIRAYQPGT